SVLCEQTCSFYRNLFGQAASRHPAGRINDPVQITGPPDHEQQHRQGNRKEKEQPDSPKHHTLYAISEPKENYTPESKACKENHNEHEHHLRAEFSVQEERPQIIRG